jgi:hypothetical protein
MRIAAIAVAVLLFPAASRAQTGGFVVTLGVDTMQVERFERKGNHIEGTVVTHAPSTMIRRYSLDIDASGSMSFYKVSATKGSGELSQQNGDQASFSRSRDSATRETMQNNLAVSTKFAAPVALFPGPGLPFLGTPILLYELGIHAAERDSGWKGQSVLPQITTLASQTKPQATGLWFIGNDSAELDYFGVARRGFKFDSHGRLIRSNWDASTYRYQMVRVAKIDVDKIARAWAARDAVGRGMGIVSPVDTVRGRVESADLTITYSRPSKRGRQVWGELVKWGQVWRFGADFATHFTTTADLDIGGTKVPAGRYTLWMLPAENGESMLIVNSAVNVFGTNYNPQRDFARIPLAKSRLDSAVERFTLSIEDGKLWIRWDDTGWAVPVNVTTN